MKEGMCIVKGMCGGHGTKIDFSIEIGLDLYEQ
jgi:hypothetical protein